MTERRTTWRRILTGWSVPAVMITAVIAAPDLLRDRLPAQASECDGSVGFTSWTALQTYPVLWTVSLLVFATVAQLVSRPHAVQGRMWVAVQWGFAASFVGSALVIVACGVGSTGTATWWTGNWAQTLAVIVIAALGFLAAGPDAPGRPATGRPSPGAPRMPLADGERLLWSRSVVSRRGIAVTGFWAALMLLMAWGHDSGGPPVEVLALLLAASVVGLQSWARVRVDGSGVHVTQSLLRRTIVGADIGEIEQARTARLEPGELSWSAYGVVQRPERTIYRTARSGEMLTLDLSGGRELAITVPDAATAAALLNSELDRRRAPAC